MLGFHRAAGWYSDWASDLASAEVENLKAGYADAARDVLKGINLTFDARSKAAKPRFGFQGL